MNGTHFTLRSGRWKRMEESCNFIGLNWNCMSNHQAVQTIYEESERRKERQKKRERDFFLQTRNISRWAKIVKEKHCEYTQLRYNANEFVERKLIACSKLITTLFNHSSVEYYAIWNNIYWMSGEKKTVLSLKSAHSWTHLHINVLNWPIHFHFGLQAPILFQYLF